MSSLNQFIEKQEQNVNQLNETLLNLQQQLNDLQTQIRVQEQVHQAQKTANKEVEDWLKQGKKLMKDLCGFSINLSYKSCPKGLQDV